MEAYRFLYVWTEPAPLQALQILGPNFPDPKIRGYAVHRLEALSDADLLDYMLQLMQVR